MWTRTVVDVLAHAYETVVRRDHEETVIGTAAEKTKDGGFEISLVPGEVGKGDDFRLY